MKRKLYSNWKMLWNGNILPLSTSKITMSEVPIFLLLSISSERKNSKSLKSHYNFVNKLNWLFLDFINKFWLIVLKVSIKKKKKLMLRWRIFMRLKCKNFKKSWFKWPIQLNKWSKRTIKLQETKASLIEDLKVKSCFNTFSTCQVISKSVCS